MNAELPIRTYSAAGGVVVDREGEHVLTLLRIGRLGPNGQPEVRLPKGHVEAGESCEQAAIREVCEEAGLKGVQILADLGQLTVEFDWNGRHTIRNENYFLMASDPGAFPEQPELQFEVEWLPWDEALARLTYEVEQEWLRRAQAAWAAHTAAGKTPTRNSVD